MTSKDFFVWFRQQAGRLNQTQVDAANQLIDVLGTTEVQSILADINKWPKGGSMRISQAGMDLIKEREGLELTAYRDNGGVLTIGYGHTSEAGGLKVVPGLKITLEQAEALLHEDLERMTYPVVDRLVRVPLTQGQFDALCSFVYNLGEGQVSKSTLLRKLNAKDYAGAANEFERWVYDNGRKLEGLVIRRQREKALFLA